MANPNYRELFSQYINILFGLVKMSIKADQNDQVELLLGAFYSRSRMSWHFDQNSKEQLSLYCVKSELCNDATKCMFDLSLFNFDFRFVKAFCRVFRVLLNQVILSNFVRFTIFGRFYLSSVDQHNYFKL